MFDNIDIDAHAVNISYWDLVTGVIGMLQRRLDIEMRFT